MSGTSLPPLFCESVAFLSGSSTNAASVSPEKNEPFLHQIIGLNCMKGGMRQVSGRIRSTLEFTSGSSESSRTALS